MPDEFTLISNNFNTRPFYLRYSKGFMSNKIRILNWKSSHVELDLHDGKGVIFLYYTRCRDRGQFDNLIYLSPSHWSSIATGCTQLSTSLLKLAHCTVTNSTKIVGK